MEDIERKQSIDHIENLKADHPDDVKDDAAKILAEAGDIEWTVEEEKKILKKIDIWVLIPMAVIYTLQQMDKSSISYSAVFGIQKGTHLEYAWLTSGLYIAQLFFQPLSSWALVRLPMAKWITANVFLWGTMVAIMAACNSFPALMAARFLLGAFESTVAPTFIAITQMWWRRREQSFRMTAWLIANSLASVFGPLLSYGVGHITSGGLKSYQSIFIFLGCITVAVTPILYYALPDDISKARFLNQREKAIAVERLRSNNTGTKTSVWKWNQVKEAFMDPKTYGWFFLLLLTALPSGGFSAFGGLITAGFGFSPFVTILFQMPIGVMQIIILVLTTWLINKYNIRWIVIGTVCIPPICGAIGMIFISRKNPHGLLGAYYVAQLLGCIQPLLYSWSNLNAGGTTKQRITTGVLFVGQCVGNIIGPQVYLTREAPNYHTGLYVNIACWALDLLGICAMGMYLRYLNKKQEKRREQLGRVGVIQDTSIMKLEESNAYKEKLAAEAAAKGEIVNENAFNDLTDWENPEFIYVI